MRFCPTALVALLVVLPLAVGRSAIVKCRDAEGHWQYADASSRACRGRTQALLTPEGVEIPPVAPKAVPDAASHANHRLLATYSSLADLKAARDRKLSGLRQERSGVTETLHILGQTLARMESLAALSPKPPANLQQNMKATEDQIAAQQQALDGYTRDLQAAKARYADMIQQYQALQSTVTP